MSFASDDPNDPNADQSQVDRATQADQAAAKAAPSSPSNDPAQGAVPSGGGGAGGVVAAGSSSGSSDGGKPSSSGSWANLQDYLGANADQGTKVGGDIASGVNSQGQAAQDSISKLDNSFQGAVNSNTVNQDQNAVNDALGTATSSGNLSPDQIAAFQKQASGTYAGPTDASKDENYGQAVGAIQNAQNSAAQTQSEAGRQVLLQNQYQNASSNGYNQGEKNLDQMLLENTAGAQQALQPLAQKWSGLNSTLGNTVTADNQAAAQAAQTNQATAQAAKSALDSTTQGFQSTLQGQVDAYRNQQSDLQQRIAAQEKTGVFDQDVANALGIQNGQSLYDVDLSKMNPNFDPNQVNIGNTASAQQYAQANALAQLAGQQTSGFLPMSNIGQAGQAPQAMIDKSALAQELGVSKGRLDHLTGPEFQALQAQFNREWNLDRSVSPEAIQATDPNALATFEKQAQAGTFTQNLADNAKKQAAFLSGQHPELENNTQAGGFDENSGYTGDQQSFQNWANIYNSLNPNRVAQVKS